MFNSESLDDSGNSFTFSDSDDVNHLVLLKDGVNFDFLFEESSGEVDFLGNVSSIDLNFYDVIFFLSEVE